MQELGTCFVDTGILVIFFRTFEAIASPRTLESSWQPKDILISLKPLTLEKRIDLVLFSSQ